MSAHVTLLMHVVPESVRTGKTFSLVKNVSHTLKEHPLTHEIEHDKFKT